MQNILTAASQKGLTVHAYGTQGDKALVELERELGIQIRGPLREFVKTIGNLAIGQFNIELSSVPGYKSRPIHITRELWANAPTLRSREAVCMMEFAECYFLYENTTERVVRIETHNIELAEEVQSWETLLDWFHWIIEHA